MTIRERLGRHWPEYLMEAWGIATFMVVAGMLATLFEYPGSPVHRAIADPSVRRILMGLAIGLTAMAIVYSPWGQQSGAHLNPAVTLTFWRLGKVARGDAIFYIVAQFVGSAVGVAIVAGVLRSAFTDAPVHYAVTMPGTAGPWVAFAAEFGISAALMFVVLTISNTSGLMRLTGVVAGGMVAAYIAVEAPLSGMSMNPARSFGSALPGGLWADQWIYFIAPPAGMLIGAAIYRRTMPHRGIACAKLDHPPHRRCIHCGYLPSLSSAPKAVPAGPHGGPRKLGAARRLDLAPKAVPADPHGGPRKLGAARRFLERRGA